jgi:hypothetical protein
MSDPRDHNRSGFDPGRPAGPRPGEEAQRFWDEYARSTRHGGQREERRGGNGAGNGHAADAPAHQCLDWCPICRAADVLRSSAPPELREQVQGLQHDAIVAVRAILDAYIERSESRPDRGDSRVEDIPID